MRPEPRPDRRLPAATDPITFAATLSAPKRRLFAASMAAQDGEALDRAWATWAHDGQLAPAACPDGAAWHTWVLMAGRGFGKTLAGAQWLAGLIAAQEQAGGEPLHIALVGASLEDARRVMIEGRSGLLTVAEPWVKAWEPSLRRLTFSTGAEATIFSGASPDLLRGPEHHLAWCDELAKWERAKDCWDMLQFGLRLGANPRALVTTTPRPGPVLRAIMAAPGAVVTRGRTRANPHLSAAWRARIEASYAGTRLGRQELDGELLPEAGALWTPELIASCRAQGSDWGPIATQRVEPASNGQPAPRSGDRTDVTDALRDGPVRCRVARAGTAQALSPANPALSRDPASSDPPLACQGRGSVGSNAPGAFEDRPGDDPTRHSAEGGGGGAPAPRDAFGGKLPFTRTLIAVDPPAGDGTCGIVAVAREGEGPTAIAHVLADHSVAGRSPEGWARAVAAAAAAHGTTEIVAEANQGGKMVKAVLLTADPNLRVRLATATKGKSLRAEPVAMWCEAGKVVFHGRMPDLEAQLLGLIAGGGYEGPGASPDRADAMVWGVTEVMRETGARVRGV